MKKLRIFDFDDTIAFTKAKVYLHKEDGTVLPMTPAEYAVYEQEPGDTFDYGEFHQLIEPQEIKWTAQILRNVIAKNGPDGAFILTARAKEEPVYQFFDMFNIPRIQVIALADANPQAKAQHVLYMIKKFKPELVEFFDDSYKNAKAVEALGNVAKKYGTTVRAHHVVHKDPIMHEQLFFSEKAAAKTKKIGFIGGGFKPFTKGHFFIIQKAAQDNDLVYLFIGMGDRARPGELPVTWDAMQKVWNKYLLKIMPSNVKVKPATNPVGSIYEQMMAYEESGDENVDLYVYGDETDLKTYYTEKKLTKYVPKLYSQGKVHMLGFDRAKGVNISGTELRRRIAAGDAKGFMQGLPEPLQNQKIAADIIRMLVPMPLKEGGLADQYIECAVCKKTIKQITRNHLVNHNMTIKEYKQLFPSSLLQSRSCKRFGADNAFYGKEHSIELKKKLSEVRKGTSLADETKRKISEALKQNVFQKEIMKTDAYRNKLHKSVSNYWSSLSTEEKKQRMSKTHNAQINNGRWTPLHMKNQKDAYEFSVRKLTEISYKKHFYAIQNAALRGKGYDLDHKISIRDGYMLGLQPETLAHPANLACIPSSENKKKNSTSSITPLMLYEAIKNETNDKKLLLLCGGLAGHMSHMHEDLDLTFGELKQILSVASEGRLENITEKLDGQNIFFTFNVAANELRFARNKGDIKSGGMNLQAIVAKWANKPNVAKSFGEAYKALSAGASSLPNKTQIFGPTGNIWYNAEILYKENVNVIDYGINSVVIHKSGVSYDSNGMPLNVDTSANYEALINAVDAMQNQSRQQTGWDIKKPVVVQLARLLDNKPQQEAIQKIDAIERQYGLNDSSTVGNLARILYANDVLKPILPNIDQDTLNEIAAIIIDSNGTSSVNQKKQDLAEIGLSPEEIAAIGKNMSADLGKHIKNATLTVEHIIHEFAIEILKGVNSALLLNPTKERARLQAETQQAIEKLKTMPDEKVKQFLAYQLPKLKDINAITAIEGIVFTYNGKTYKLAGAFSPVNKLLGAFKYGL